MSQATLAGPSTLRTVFIASGAALTALTALKFLYILVEENFDLSRAPVVFIIPTVALLVGLVLTIRLRPAGVWIVAIVSLILGVVLVAALVRRGIAQQNWADAVLVFAGIPLAGAVLIGARPMMRD